MRIGLIGCGNIAGVYAHNAGRFADIALTAVADINPAAAEALAEDHGLRALSVEALLTDPQIDLVVNLTVPGAHAEVTEAALQAGKHVYVEKPFCLDVATARTLLSLSEEKGLRLGSAPDTFLGPGCRFAKQLIRSGRLGTIHSGTAFMLSPGMEHWHPNPGFFFQPGGGPLLDMGPYYVTHLVEFFGPVAEVKAFGGRPRPTRRVSAAGPMQGRDIPVEVDTTAMALLQFRSGPQIVLMTSWDVQAHRQSHFELYGTEGTLRVPDPNHFGGDVVFWAEGKWRKIASERHPLGRPNWPLETPQFANYRMIGVAEMAQAIREDRPSAVDASRAVHVLEVLLTIEQLVREG